MQRRIVTGIAVGSLAITLAALALVPMYWRERKEELVSSQLVISGEVALVPLPVDGREIDRIEKVHKSCGCMRVLSSDKQEVPLPFEVARDQKERIYIEVATRGRAGRAPFNVVLDGVSQGVKTLKAVNFDLDILPGWHLSPSRIRRDNCEENEVIDAEIKVFRHELATGLELEQVIASNDQRMSFDIEPIEHDGTEVENGLELVAVAKLRYRVMPEAYTDTLTFVGSDGQVRANVDILAKTRSPELMVNPRVLYWDARDDSRIVWIEHGAQCSPSVVSSNETFDISFGETHSESESRTVTRVTITGRFGGDLDSDAVDAQARSDNYEIVFGCGDDRVALRVIQR
jgi:hypothetical protein